MSRGRGWRRRGALLGALLLALATGLCVFGAGHTMAGDQEMSPDLCVLMLAVPLTVVLLAAPLLGGWAQPDRPSRLVFVPVHALDPPPKPLSLS